MIPIVFSTDHNYIMPTGVTIASLLINRENIDYDIRILISPDVTKEDKELIKQQIFSIAPSSKLSFFEMGSYFQNGFEIREISSACYFRLLIPWIFPDVDKIIYCDVDIIFKTSLEGLFSIDLEDSYVAGSYPNFVDGWKPYQKYFRKLSLDYRKYINSGILLINSKLQRDKNLKKEYLELAKRKFIYQDQDIINIVCKDKIKYFNNKYNLMPSNYGLKEEYINDIIIHYTGDKPWKTFTYAWNEWWNIYEKSIFFDGEFYHQISKKIMNPKMQLKHLYKKVKNKLYQKLFFTIK